MVLITIKKNFFQPVQKLSPTCVPDFQAVVKRGGDQLVRTSNYYLQLSQKENCMKERGQQQVTIIQPTKKYQVAQNQDPTRYPLNTGDIAKMLVQSV